MDRFLIETPHREQDCLNLIQLLHAQGYRSKDYWEALHPFSAGGAYVNFMMEEGQDRVQATYRDNYDRLAAIKKKYDPKNFFRVNQNIRPSK
jgi:FAD/FMN-containing dehydrogenase